MSKIDYIYRSTRDVIGGAFGGLLSAAALTTGNQLAITALGVSLVLFLAALYVLFDRLKDTEKEQAESGETSENNWPTGPAS